jgi:hypothetical protein
MKTKTARQQKLRLALRHKKLTRAHVLAARASERDSRAADVLLDMVAVDQLGLGPAETAALLATEEDNANT